MIKDISEFINKYIWNLNKNEKEILVLKTDGIIWYCLIQILNQFTLNYSQIYPKQMITIAINTIKIEYIAATNQIRSQLITNISNAMKEYPKLIFIYFLLYFYLILI